MHRFFSRANDIIADWLVFTRRINVSKKFKIRYSNTDRSRRYRHSSRAYSHSSNFNSIGDWTSSIAPVSSSDRPRSVANPKKLIASQPPEPDRSISTTTYGVCVRAGCRAGDVPNSTSSWKKLRPLPNLLSSEQTRP